MISCQFPFSYLSCVTLCSISSLVRMTVEWVGFGYCAGNHTNSHGAEVYLWNYTGLKWMRFGRYANRDSVGPDSLVSTPAIPLGWPEALNNVNCFAGDPTCCVDSSSL